MLFPVQTRGLAPDEQYQQSLAYGLIIGTAALSLVVCGLRVSLDSLHNLQQDADNSCSFTHDRL